MKTIIFALLATIIFIRVLLGVLFWALDSSSVQKKTSTDHSDKYLKMVSGWIALNANHFDSKSDLFDSVKTIFGVVDKDWIVSQIK